jgi:AcrR family transcriptional regulator
MKRKRAAAKISRGRPRRFDPDKALDRALNVFWRKGYEGASLPELTRAMGINRPSMYAAFGNKEALFKKALARYHEGPAAAVRAALEQPRARAVIEQLFDAGIDLVTDSRHPRGCLAVQAALACGDEAQCVQKALITHRESGVTGLRRRLERAQAEGDLPRSADPAALARFAATVMHGIAVQAAGGATRKELRRVAELALLAFPS